MTPPVFATAVMGGIAPLTLREPGIISQCMEQVMDRHYMQVYPRTLHNPSHMMEVSYKKHYSTYITGNRCRPKKVSLLGSNQSQIDGPLMYKVTVRFMVLILDGYSEINRCARMEHSLLFDLLRHLIKQRAVANRILFSQKIPIFLHVCASCSEIPYNVNKYKNNISQTGSFRYGQFLRYM